ncbi:hypothetical protein Dsin_002246 [Dipteronia sinensis]|uniref:HAT C-terminal dimerisation domain-containing protein n=1 Tax=Dipteronia sinensis TaxID=43782 RepID=A0AAE0EL25_9ROSI|nr:hypothetical protein Dsin_002246 [Dipteronia sinensis]
MRTKLFEVFRIYEYIFGDVNTQPSEERDIFLLKRSWSILNRRKSNSSSRSSSSSQAPRVAATRGVELNRFLETLFDLARNTEEFDLLLWWKNYGNRYLILSQFARDVLDISVSTVSSEHAFNTSGRIIEPRRTYLSPEMVEVLTCLRDWECSNEDATSNGRPRSYSKFHQFIRR